MPYATLQNMMDRFGERELIALTDRDNTGIVDAAVLARGLQSADDEINPYLVARYTIPPASVPAIVSNFACDIARYRLCGAEVIETDEIRNRYKDAIKFFEKVSKGEISLGLDALSQTVASKGSVHIRSDKAVFNKEKLSDY
jgi:phage gp36-like protein